MRKFIHLTKYLPTFYGGVERVTQVMAEGGKRLGADVHVIGADPAADVSEKRSKADYKETALPRLLTIGPVPISPGFFFLKEEFKKADVVHVYLPNPMAELALMAHASLNPKEKRPKIVTIINAPILRWGSFGKYWQDTTYAKLAQISDKVVVTCKEMIQCLSCLAPYTDKIELIPNPIEPKVTVDSRKKKKSDPFKIISIGRLVYYKGFDVLIDAVATLPGNWELTIIGGGAEHGALQRKIDSHGLNQKVRLTKSIDEKEKMEKLAESDLFVLPSRTIAEAYGVAIAEAFYFKKPVITTTLPTGVSFLSRKGECGAVVPPESPDQLRQAISTLMNDPKKRAESGAANHRFWNQELRMETFHERYESMISNILETEQKKAA